MHAETYYRRLVEHLTAGLEGRKDNPWYPSMRLFRQEVEGKWNSVIGNVALELKTIAAQNKLISY